MIDILVSTVLISGALGFIEVKWINKYKSKQAKLANYATVFVVLLVANLAMAFLQKMGINYFGALLILLVPVIYSWNKLDRARDAWIKEQGLENE